MTIDLKVFSLVILGFALLALIVYLIIVVSKLAKTIDKTNRILDDAEKISGIASARAEDVNQLITNASDAANGLVSAVKGNTGTISAITSLINGAAALREHLNKKKK